MMGPDYCSLPKYVSHIRQINDRSPTDHNPNLQIDQIDELLRGNLGIRTKHAHK